MIKVLITICSLMVISMLTACNGGQSLLFTGESNHWKGAYTTNAGGNNEDGTFTFTFNDGGKPTFKNLEVDVSGGNGHPVLKEDSHTGSTIKINESGSGIATTKASTVFNVTIKWDNKYKETFSLKSKKHN
ncbi:hypothetical protein PU629_16315 [Pullulanibacillus sp. KACC 23026]|uniref:hypothetical protein n=1 Tax=Pullulanibacillus sp. KACC 23026 TaxID=3028315 RepID=UPI0023AFA32F|nr:hypothetical protein [Pullulanibacillus sp. KACC 23026]WEG11697.1 hypothetical protein PU629_16315 [Pullulanibacillus sp. KACC 23026]